MLISYRIHVFCSVRMEVFRSRLWLPLKRGYASGIDVMNVFDRNAKRSQRNRAAIAEDAHVYDYLKDEVASRMVDRVCDIARFFPVALDVGCGRGHIAKQMNSDILGTLYQCDMAENMVSTSSECPDKEVITHKLLAEEDSLPFDADTFHLVVSSLSLHWVNDLPKALSEVLRVLKKDGVFVGSLFSGDTLYELRSSLHLAEMEREGGIAPHVSPFTEMRDMGNLLTRTGYNMTTVDIDEIVVHYPSMFELMYDLKGMGESSADWRRKNYMRRDTLKAAGAIYQELYGCPDGSVPATFQLLYFIGWKPDLSHLAPSPRGSATASLKDLGKLSNEKLKR